MRFSEGGESAEYRREIAVMIGNRKIPKPKCSKPLRTDLLEKQAARHSIAMPGAQPR
jgi:hypothetical protein